MSTEHSQSVEPVSDAGDGSRDSSQRQKLSDVQIPKESGCVYGINIDHNGEQLLVSARPRPQIGVAVIATPNVAHSEIAHATEEILTEIRHTRAIAGHGFDKARELDASEARGAFDDQDVSDVLRDVLETCENGDVTQHIQRALEACEAESGGEADGV